MKQKVGLLIIIVLTLICITATITYAYFGPNIVGNESKVKTNTGKLNLKIDDNSVSSFDITPIYDDDYEMLAYHKDFEVVSDSSLNACSKLYLHINDISNSLRSKYFKYRLVGEQVDVSGDFEKSKQNEDLLILDNLYLESGTTNFFNLYIWISYQDDVDQLDMLGTKLDAHLVISGIDSKNESECK